MLYIKFLVVQNISTALLWIFIILSSINLSESLLHCKCNDHNKCLKNDQMRLGNSSNSYCTINEKGHCFAARVTEYDSSVHPVKINIVDRFGCLSTDSKVILSCKGHYINSTKPIAIDCCNKTNFCNVELHPKFYYFNSDQEVINFVTSHLSSRSGNNKLSTYVPPQINTGAIMIAVFVSVLIVCMCVCVAVVCYCRQRLHWASKHVLGPGGVSRMCGTQENVLLPTHPPPHSHTATSGSLMTASSLLTTTMTNLSHNRLTQRTIAHQILFTQLLGKGRFSEVWAGDWLGESVAIKHLFQSGQLKTLHETLWLRTIRLYYSYPVQHNHVVSLLGSDKIPPDTTGACSLTLLLIYPYYHWGTLSRMMASSHWDLSASSAQSLQANSRLDTLSRMALSLVAGLCYLHTEIAATKGKPAIAHRNLKSSNIYVKDDYSCCIGDLEWALVGSSKDDDRCNLDSQILPQLTIPNGLVQLPDFEYYVSNVLLSSDCRYVAPELLEGSDVNNIRSHSLSSVDEYKKSDVYSLSLILWELLVWFEPRLKRHHDRGPVPLPPATRPSASSPLLSSSASTVAAEASLPPPDEQSLLTSTWIYEPAYQIELISLRQSLSCDPSYLHDDPQSTEMHSLHSQSIRPTIDIQRLLSSDQSSSSTVVESATGALVRGGGGGGGIIEVLCQIIPQCWCTVPDSRLSCLKIKKYLSPISDPSSVADA